MITSSGRGDNTAWLSHTVGDESAGCAGKNF